MSIERGVDRRSRENSSTSTALPALKPYDVLIAVNSCRSTRATVHGPDACRAATRSRKPLRSRAPVSRSRWNLVLSCWACMCSSATSGDVPATGRSLVRCRSAGTPCGSRARSARSSTSSASDSLRKSYAAPLRPSSSQHSAEPRRCSSRVCVSVAVTGWLNASACSASAPAGSPRSRVRRAAADSTSTRSGSMPSSRQRSTTGRSRCRHNPRWPIFSSAARACRRGRAAASGPRGGPSPARPRRTSRTLS